MGRSVKARGSISRCYSLGDAYPNLEDCVHVECNLQNKSFFAMQAEHKLAIAHPGGPEPQRGYSGIGAESSAGLYRRGILKAQLMEDLRDSRVSREA